MTERPQVAEEWDREEPSRRPWFWLALVAMVAVCLFAVYRSALFRMGQVTVNGAQQLTPERIMAAAGLQTGAPRWEHPAAEVERRLMAEPWIKSARAAWNWNRLSIQIEERAPLALVRYYDTFYLVLDETGTILEQVPLSEGQGMPVISGVIVTKALRGQQLGHQGLAEALTLIGSIAEPLRNQVSEVYIDKDRALTLFMASGPTVTWGIVPNEKDRLALLDAKIELFGGFWKDVSRKNSRTCMIDMRVPGKAIASGCQ